MNLCRPSIFRGVVAMILRDAGIEQDGRGRCNFLSVFFSLSSTDNRKEAPLTDSSIDRPSNSQPHE